jgi:hypothetical protein
MVSRRRICKVRFNKEGTLLLLICCPSDNRRIPGIWS